MASAASNNRRPPPWHIRGKAEPLPKLVHLTIYAILAAALFYELGVTSLGGVGAYNIGAADPVIPAVALGLWSIKGWRKASPLLLVLALAMAGLSVLSVSRALGGNPVVALMSLRDFGVVSGLLLLGAGLSAGRYDLTALNVIIIRAALAFSPLAAARLILGPEFLFFGQNVDGRPLTSGTAILVAAALLICLARTWQALQSGKVGPHAVYSVILLSILLISGQGTVLFSFGAAIVILFGVFPGRYRPIRLILFLGLLAIFLLFRDTDFLSAMPDWLIDSAVRRQTLTAREEVWAAALDRYNAWPRFEQAFGMPAGSQLTLWVRLWEGRYWEVSLHSQYVGLLIKLGALGLATYLAVLAAAAFNAARRLLKERRGDDAAVSLAFVGLIATFGYGYELPPQLYLVVALAMAASSAAPQLAGARAFRLVRLDERGLRQPGSSAAGRP